MCSLRRTVWRFLKRLNTELPMTQGPHSWHIPRENHNLKKCSTTYNSQGHGHYLNVDRRMHKEDAVYIYNITQP